MAVLRILGNLIRFPLLVVLRILAPVVETLCAAALVLGLFAAVLFEVSAAGPTFPFWRIAGLSLGFGLLLILYTILIELLSPR